MDDPVRAIQVKPAAPADQLGLEQVAGRAFDPVLGHFARSMLQSAQAKAGRPAPRRGGAPADRARVLVAHLPSPSSSSPSSPAAPPTVVGGALLRTFTVGPYHFGLVAWIFSDPAVHGRGVGRALLDAALAWFSEQGCDAVLASVDGYNSRSWNLFHHAGFCYWSPAAQLRAVRWRWLQLLTHALHALDAGHFLLMRPLSGLLQLDGRVARRWRWPAAAAFLLASSFVAAWLRWGLGERLLAWSWWLDWGQIGTQLGITAAAVGTIWGLVQLGQAAWVKMQPRRASSRWPWPRPWRFRVWESGLFLMGLMALCFGVYIPMVGGWYLARPNIRYADGELRRQLGNLAAVGAVVALLISAGAVSLLAMGRLGAVGPVDLLLGLGRLLLWAGLGFGVAHFVLAIPPFQAMPAAHLWRWQPQWAGVGLAAFSVLTAAGMWLIIG